MHQWRTRGASSMIRVEFPNSTSMTLIDRVKLRDKDAWERLVALYSPFLHYWCRRWGVSAADAEDVIQEVFQAVARNLATFRREKSSGSFRGWLRTIARNKAVSLGRRRDPRGQGGTDFYRRSLLIPDPQFDCQADSAAADSEAMGILYEQALELVRNEFEDRTWQAFWRSVVEGQSPSMIANDLAVTPAAVRQAKSRVLRRLKQLLCEPPSDLVSRRPVARKSCHTSSDI